MKRAKKLLCLALSLIMLLLLFPTAALATDLPNAAVNWDPVGDGAPGVPNNDATLDDEDEILRSAQDDEDVPEPVRVTFVCDPAETVVTVYDPAQPDENGEPTAIDPEEDGSWLLLPGTYLYDAEAEGDAAEEQVEFEVKASEENSVQKFEIKLESIPAVKIRAAVKAENTTVGLITSFSESYRNDGPYYGKLLEAKAQFTSDSAWNVKLVAESQEGYTGSSDSSNRSGVVTGNAGYYTEYNQWYHGNTSNHDSYCNLFVSWCLHAAGVSESIAPKNPFYITHAAYNDWRECGAEVYSWKDYMAGSYTPKPGDILLYEISSSSDVSGSSLSGTHSEHVGIITVYDPNTKKITTMEGATSGCKVAPRTRTPRESDGYAGYQNSSGKNRYYYAFIRPSYNQGGGSSGGDYLSNCAYSPSYLTVTAKYDNLNMWSLPCNSSTDSSSYKIYDNAIPLNASMDVSGLYLNTQGNYWYKCTYNGKTGYVYCENVTVSSYRQAEIENGVKYSGRALPSNHTVNTIFNVDWTVTSSNAPLLEISGFISDTEKTITGTPIEQISRPSEGSYVFSKNLGASTLDKSLPFMQLVVGPCRLSITVKVANYYSADASTLSAKFYSIPLIDHAFNVVSAGSTTPSLGYFDLNGMLDGVDTGNITGYGTVDIYINGNLEASNVTDFCSQYPYGTSYEIRNINTAQGRQYNGVYSGTLSGTIDQEWVSTYLSFSTKYSTFDLNGYLDGIVLGIITGYGVCDVYINGALVAQSTDDYYAELPVGTTYEIKNIRSSDGHQYDGIYSGALSGTVGEERTEVLLSFSTLYYDLDLNGLLDGTEAWNIGGFGTVDVYINGNLVESGCSDFNGIQWTYGTTYEFRNIRPNNGYSYDGISDVAYDSYTAGGRTGMITQNTSVRLILHTCPTSIDENPEPVVFNGHTYYFFSTPVTWYNAKTICENMGGHLATVTSAEEGAFVYALAEETFAWLGGTDIGSEGNWRWITGESFSYANWHSENPDNYDENPEGAENYLQYGGASGGVWNDNAGCSKFPFVCEIDSATYTVAYDANGGTGAPANQTKTHDVALTLSSTEPTRASSSAGSYTVTLNANGGSVTESSLTAARTTSYSFESWNTAQDGSGTSYNPGATYSSSADVTLYAQWNSNTTTAAVTLPTPTREGYSFLGWAESADAQSGMTGSYTPSADITLYAIWKENAPPISPDAPGFHVASVTGRAGGTVTVPVTIKNNPGIALFKVNVDYDENILEWTGISHKALDGFWSAEVGKPVVWVGNGDAEYEDDGEIFTLTFAVKENIEPQTTSIHLSYDPDDIQSWNEELIDYENVAFAVIEGKVNIVSTVSLTGTALSWNNNADVEVLLYTADTEDSVLNAAAQSGDYSGAPKTGVLGEITASGKQYACTFTVSDIEPGTYKLLVMKPGKYVPVIRTVELNEDTTLDAITLWLYGDVTADGKVNGTDALQIKRYFANISSVFTKGTEQEKVERLIAANVTAVRSGDDKVNGTDALQIQRYFADISSVFMYMR